MTRVVVHRVVRPIHDTARGPGGPCSVAARPDGLYQPGATHRREPYDQSGDPHAAPTTRGTSVPSSAPAARRLSVPSRSPGLSYADPAASRDLHRRGD